MSSDTTNTHTGGAGQECIDEFLNQLWGNGTQIQNQDGEDLNGYSVPWVHNDAQMVPSHWPSPLLCGDISGTVSDLQQSSTLNGCFAHFEPGGAGSANMITGGSDPTARLNGCFAHFEPGGAGSANMITGGSDPTAPFSGFHHAMGVGNSPLTPPVDASRIAVSNTVQHGFSSVESPGYSPCLFSMDQSRIAVPTSINLGRVSAQDAACSPVIPALSNSRIEVPTSISLGPAFSGMTRDPAKSSTTFVPKTGPIHDQLFTPGNLSRTPSLPRSTQMAQCCVDLLQQTKLTPKDNIGILEFREQIIDARRWPIRVISKTITHDSVSYMLCKGQDLYFQYSEEEVLTQTLKSTSIYYATSKTTETIAQVCKKNNITQEELVARNSRLNGIERLGKKAKFKTNTYLNVGDIAPK